jgi:histidinol-phosphate aminotransferase
LIEQLIRSTVNGTREHEFDRRSELHPDDRNPQIRAVLSQVEHVSSATPTEVAREMESLGGRTFPTETYFFLADFSPHDASDIATQLRERNIFVKPLENSRLGPGYMRMTTASPEDNERVIAALKEIL